MVYKEIFHMRFISIWNTIHSHVKNGAKYDFSWDGGKSWEEKVHFNRMGAKTWVNLCLLPSLH
jgi:hypothetical protein